MRFTDLHRFFDVRRTWDQPHFTCDHHSLTPECILLSWIHFDMSEKYESIRAVAWIFIISRVNAPRWTKSASAGLCEVRTRTLQFWSQSSPWWMTASELYQLCNDFESLEHACDSCSPHHLTHEWSFLANISFAVFVRCKSIHTLVLISITTCMNPLGWSTSTWTFPMDVGTSSL